MAIDALIKYGGLVQALTLLHLKTMHLPLFYSQSSPKCAQISAHQLILPNLLNTIGKWHKRELINK
jgi:hypothetical protein